jgi:pimeloyl-ACP methyl ester carboxylesterase
MNAADQYLAVPGARLRYRDEGAGASVVLVHGWTLDLDIWQPQAALAEGLRVVRYDRRGFGCSTGEASLLADVDDLRALIARLAIPRPLLVGMSQGARVVLEFAARHPGIARALILDGPPPPGTGDLPMAQFREIAARDGVDAFRAVWSRHPLTRLMTTDSAAHAQLARVLARYPGADLLAAREYRESLDDSVLAQIRLPVRILNGEHDVESRRRAGADLRARLDGAVLDIIAGAGHLPSLDATLAYNAIVDEYARRRLPAVA